MYGGYTMSRSIGNVNATSAPTYTIYQGGESGSYSTPLGCSYIIVQMIGGGGGGGFQANGIGGGGGSAPYLELQFPAGTYAYSCGAGGIAGTPTNNGNGRVGKDTTFDAALSAGGGGGRNDGGGGNPGVFTTAGRVLYAIRGVFGASIIDPSFVTTGGASFLGPAVPFSSDFDNTPNPARGYGAGGTGATTASVNVARAGAPGRIVITEYY